MLFRSPASVRMMAASGLEPRRLSGTRDARSFRGGRGGVASHFVPLESSFCGLISNQKRSDYGIDWARKARIRRETPLILPAALAQVRTFSRSQIKPAVSQTRVLVSFARHGRCNPQSFPRKREPSPSTAHFRRFAEWIPAFAGMTGVSKVIPSQMTPPPKQAVAEPCVAHGSLLL